MYRGVFAVHFGATPMTAAQRSRITDALDMLGGEWAWIEHTHPNHHAQGVFRSDTKRDAATVAGALGVNDDAIRPIGRDKLAFARSVKYLLHDGEYPDAALVTNFDWRAEVARLPAPPAPTLTVLTRQVYEGAITPDQIADRWPDIYLRHGRKFDDAARRRSERDRTERERAERDRTERERAERERERAAREEAARERERAEREALEASRRAWCAAEAAWRASPEGLAYETAERLREAAREARRAEQARADAEARWRTERAMWAIYFVAADNGITGDAASRQRGVAKLLGRAPTPDACIAYMRAEYGWGEAECEDELRTTQADVEADNNIFGLWRGMEKQDSDAFALAMRLKRLARRYPDLYEFHYAAPAPGTGIPDEWRKELMR